MRLVRKDTLSKIQQIVSSTEYRFQNEEGEIENLEPDIFCNDIYSMQHNNLQCNMLNGPLQDQPQQKSSKESERQKMCFKPGAAVQPPQRA